jgi:hypothetical protein
MLAHTLSAPVVVLRKFGPVRWIAPWLHRRFFSRRGRG